MSLIQEGKVRARVGGGWAPVFHCPGQPVQGQPPPPLSGYYHSRIACERRCSDASGRSTAPMVENDLDPRLVWVQSASPKTISTENEKELPACLTTGAPLRSWCTST